MVSAMRTELINATRGPKNRGTQRSKCHHRLQQGYSSESSSSEFRPKPANGPGFQGQYVGQHRDRQPSPAAVLLFTHTSQRGSTSRGDPRMRSTGTSPDRSHIPISALELLEESKSSAGFADDIALDGIQFYKFKSVAIVRAAAHNCVHAKRTAHTGTANSIVTDVPAGHPLTNKPAIPALLMFKDRPRMTRWFPAATVATHPPPYRSHTAGIGARQSWP